MVDNPSNPGEGPSPQVNLTDIMNTAKFQQELSELIAAAFSSAGEKASKSLFDKLENADNKFKETRKRNDSEVYKARLAFTSKVFSQERAAHAQHIKDYTEQRRILKASGQTASDLAEFDKANRRIGMKLSLQADAAEGSHLAKSKLAMMEKVEAISKYNIGLAAAGGLWVAIAAIIQRAVGFSSDLAKEQAALNAGGVKVSSRERLFSQIPSTLLGAQERVEAGTALARSPQALGGSPEDFKRYIGVFGNIIPDMKQLIGLLGDASHAQNISAKDLVNIFKLTKPAYAGIKVDQRELIKTSLTMSESLRGVTTNATLAGRVLDMMNGPLEKIKASPEEIMRLNGAMAQFLGGLSMEQLTGLAAFNNGGGMPTDDQLKSIMDDPIDTVIGAFKKIETQLPDPTRKLVALEQVTKQFGISLNPRGVIAFGELLKEFKPGQDRAAFNTRLQGIQKQFGTGMSSEIERGFAQIAKSDGLIKIFERMVDNLMVKLGTPLLGYVGSIATVASKFGMHQEKYATVGGRATMVAPSNYYMQDEAKRNISESLRKNEDGRYQVGKGK